MITDALLQLSGTIVGNTVTGQTVTGTGNVISTNTVDLVKSQDIGQGEDLYLRSQVTAAFAGATSVEIQAIAADDAALTSNITVIATTGPIPVASLVAGGRFAACLRPRIASLGQRYLGARYVITGTGTAGALFTDIGLEIQDGQKFYASGFQVR